MIKDSVGNRMAEDQFVEIKLPPGTGALRGRVKTIDEGRITRIGGAHKSENGSMQPGLLTIEIMLPVEVDPRSNVAFNVVRIWDPSGKDVEPKSESLSSQIERLGAFILAEVPGEPSQNEGAVDCAIRLLSKKKAKLIF